MSKASIQKGVLFAKSISAKVTGLYVMPEFHVVADANEEFAGDCRALANQFLSVIEEAAKAAAVTCDTALAISDHPYEAIIKAAEDKGCDLVVMASHGRKAFKGSPSAARLTRF